METKQGDERWSIGPIGPIGPNTMLGFTVEILSIIWHFPITDPCMVYLSTFGLVD